MPWPAPDRSRGRLGASAVLENNHALRSLFRAAWERAEVVSLSLSARYRRNASGNVEQDPIEPCDWMAQVQFGSDGGSHILEVDGGQGVSISLPCNSIDVGVRLERGVGPILVSGSVGFGSTSRGGTRTRRVVVPILGGASSAAIPIPPFAADCRVHGVPLNFSGSISWRDSWGSNVGESPVNATLNLIAGIPQAARYAQYHNGATAPAVTALFLAFGLVV